MPMDATRWKRVQALFDAAADLADGARERYLDDACGDDRALAAEVRG